MAGQSSFTPELGDAICELMITGDLSLRQVAKRVGVPHPTILLWALREPAFADQYARAMEIRDDAAFEALEDLMGQEPERVTIQVGGGSGEAVIHKTVVDNGWVAWQRERKDALKWSLSKRRPKKYGERLSVEQSGSVELVTISDRLKQARKHATTQRDSLNDGK